MSISDAQVEANLKRGKQCLDHVMLDVQSVLLGDGLSSSSKRLKQQHASTSQLPAHWQQPLALPPMPAAASRVPPASEPLQLASLLASLPVQLTSALPGIIQQAVQMTCNPCRPPNGSTASTVHRSMPSSHPPMWPSGTSPQDLGRHVQLSQLNLPSQHESPSAVQHVQGSAHQLSRQAAEQHAAPSDLVRYQEATQPGVPWQPYPSSVVQQAEGSLQQPAAGLMGTARHQNDMLCTQPVTACQPSIPTRTSFEQLLLGRDPAHPGMQTLLSDPHNTPHRAPLLRSPNQVNASAGVGASPASIPHSLQPSGDPMPHERSFVGPASAIGLASDDAVGGFPAIKQEPAIRPGMGNGAGPTEMAGDAAVTHALRTPDVAACVLQLLQPHLVVLAVRMPSALVHNEVREHYKSISKAHDEALLYGVASAALFKDSLLVLAKNMRSPQCHGYIMHGNHFKCTFGASCV